MPEEEITHFFPGMYILGKVLEARQLPRTLYIATQKLPIEIHLCVVVIHGKAFNSLSVKCYNIRVDEICQTSLHDEGGNMRYVFIVLMTASMTLALPSTYELSIDNGIPTYQWVYTNGGSYVAVDYTIVSSSYLTGIKYAVSTTWPDSTMQGYGVCAWSMGGGAPGSIIWPTNGIPIYNPNSSGTPGDPGPGFKWVIQSVSPSFALPSTQFLVGINFRYTYPSDDAIATDGTGAGPHDWGCDSGGWMMASYGKNMIRAQLVMIMPGMECGTLGAIRVMYR